MSALFFCIVYKKSNNLFVAGARIDHGHHHGIASLALHETLALEEAVAKAMELTSEEDTLIVVTADHSHTMSIGSYAKRGNPIFGTKTNSFGNLLINVRPCSWIPS